MNENPRKSSTAKADEHTQTGFSMSIMPSFKNIKKKFYEFLRGHVMEIISSKKKKNEVINK